MTEDRPVFGLIYQACGEDLDGMTPAEWEAAAAAPGEYALDAVTQLVLDYEERLEELNEAEKSVDITVSDEVMVLREHNRQYRTFVESIAGAVVEFEKTNDYARLGLTVEDILLQLEHEQLDGSAG